MQVCTKDRLMVPDPCTRIGLTSHGFGVFSRRDELRAAAPGPSTGLRAGRRAAARVDPERRAARRQRPAPPAPAGSALPPERELSERFGVGRTPIREALRALQTKGLPVATGPTAPLRVVA